MKTWRHKNMVSKLFIALIVITNSALYFVTGISEICRHEDTKNMVSKLFIALIVISNLAFLWHNFMKFQDTKIMVSKLLIALHLKTWRHKKYGVKTFYCSHCDKKFILFWHSFLKFEDIKTQKVWCQIFWLLSLW